jgi:hypothetical protein
MLQERVGKHRHERVSVQARPGAAFKVIETEFFLHLLVRDHEATTSSAAAFFTLAAAMVLVRWLARPL